METADFRNNEEYQRLLELKKQYHMMQTKIPREGMNPNLLVPPHEEKKPMLPRNSFKRNKNEQMDGTQLQICIKQIIEKSGGPVHIDTITEYVKSYWPNLQKPDGSNHSYSEFKRLVLQHLRNKPNFFEKDKRFEGCWIVIPSELNIDNLAHVEPILDKILSFNELCSGIFVTEDLYKYISDNWNTPIINGNPLNEEETKDIINLHILSHPRFKREEKSSGPQTEQPQKDHLPKKRKPNFEQDHFKNKRKKSFPPKDQVHSVSTTSNKDSEGGGEGQGQEEEDNYISNSDDSSPSSNIQGSKFQGKEKKKKQKEKSSDDNWIQCDGCGTWVPTNSDNITNLWLYDDRNPSHLEYHCPLCREKKKDKRKGSRKSKPPLQGSMEPQIPSIAPRYDSNPPLASQYSPSPAYSSSTRRNPSRRVNGPSSPLSPPPSMITSPNGGSLHDQLNLESATRDCLEELEDLLTGQTDPKKAVTITQLKEKVANMKTELQVMKHSLANQNKSRVEQRVQRLRVSKEEADLKIEETLAREMLDFFRKTKSQLLPDS